MEDGLSVWAPVLHLGDPEALVVAWPGPAWLSPGSCGHLRSISADEELSYSDFQTDKSEKRYCILHVTLV